MLSHNSFQKVLGYYKITHSEQRLMISENQLKATSYGIRELIPYNINAIREENGRKFWNSTL